MLAKVKMLATQNSKKQKSLGSRFCPTEDSCAGDVTFSVQNPGVQNMSPSTSSPLVYFVLFLTEEILTKIVRETKHCTKNIFLTNRDNLSPQSCTR